MSNITIKEVLHNYIDSGDDKLLQMIYAIVREYNNPVFSEADITELEARTTRRKNGESKTYEWPEAKSIMTGKTGIKG